MAADPNLANKKPSVSRAITSTGEVLDAVAIDPNGTITSISYTNGYIDPTAARWALLRARYSLAGCCAYDPGNRNFPRLDVTFRFPITVEQANAATAILDSLVIDTPVSPAAPDDATGLLIESQDAADAQDDPPPVLKPSQIRAAEIAAAEAAANAKSKVIPAEAETSPVLGDSEVVP